MSVNSGLYEVTRVTGVYKIASNEMGHHKIEENTKDKILRNCVKAKEVEKHLEGNESNQL